MSADAFYDVTAKILKQSRSIYLMPFYVINIKNIK